MPRKDSEYKSTTISKKIHEKISTLAKCLGVSVSDLAEEAIIFYLASDDCRNRIKAVIGKRKEELQRQIQQLEEFVNK
jgi:(p)ppGpp synthase/HD superfamily hydrolase